MKMIRGKAPLRISFAGGGTDLNYVFEKYGGIVISTSIDKFCHMTIEKRKDKEIWVNGRINNEQLVKDIIEFIKPEFGFNLIYYNDVEPGTGLGNSSSFVVLLVTLILELQGKKCDDRTLAEITHQIESKNGLTGWQDQYSTIVGGFNFMEFTRETKNIYPLRLKYTFLCDLEEYLVLCRVKGDHKTSNNQKKQKKHVENLENMSKILYLKDIAIKIKECLLNQKINEIGLLLKQGWELKRNKVTSNKQIDDLYEKGLKNGAIGGRLCGSGQGGYILFFVNPKNRTKLINKLDGVLPFHFANQGVETWRC